MEIRQLRYFVNAARTLNFTEAARLSNVAQSTLSQQIKQLETELGIPLFHRMGKSVKLTTEGATFLNDANRIIDDARQGLQRLADMKELRSGNVAVGIASGLGISALLAEVLQSYNKTYPGVRITIHQVQAPRLSDMLRRHDIDLAMTFTPETAEPDIQVRPLFGSRLCAVLGEHHPLAEYDKVSLAQVSRHPLVLPSHNLIIRKPVDAAAARQHVDLRPAVEIDDLSHIIYMVRGGRWVSILPDVATMAVRGLACVPLDVLLPLPTSVLTLADVYQRKAVTEFLRILQQSVNLLLVNSQASCDVCGERFIPS